MTIVDEKQKLFQFTKMKYFYYLKIYKLLLFLHNLILQIDNFQKIFYIIFIVFFLIYIKLKTTYIKKVKVIKVKA